VLYTCSDVLLQLRLLPFYQKKILRANIYLIYEMDGRRGDSNTGRGGSSSGANMRRREAAEQTRSSQRGSAVATRRGVESVMGGSSSGPAKFESIPFVDSDPFEQEEERYKLFQEWQDTRLMTIQRSNEIKDDYSNFRAAQGLAPLDDKDLLLLTVLSALNELRESVSFNDIGTVYDELGNLSSFLDSQYFDLNPQSYTPMEEFLQLSDSDEE